LVPPIPITRHSDPILVWGWHIVRRAHTIGTRQLVVQALDLRVVDALKLALKLENRCDSYTWKEQAAFVTLFESVQQGSGPSEDDWQDLSALVRGDGALRQLVRKYRQLGPAAGTFVDEGLIPLRTGLAIGTIPDDLLTDIKPQLAQHSLSVRRQFLEMLSELIAHSSTRPVAGTKLGIRARNTEPRNADELCRWAKHALCGPDPLESVRRLRYPILTDLEERFAMIRDATLKGTGVDLRAPPFFEGVEYEVTFQFKSCTDLQRRVRALERVIATCEDLVGILH
jgi:hypothetical protein